MKRSKVARFMGLAVAVAMTMAVMPATASAAEAKQINVHNKLTTGQIQYMLDSIYDDGNIVFPTSVGRCYSLEIYRLFSREYAVKQK